MTYFPQLQDFRLGTPLLRDRIPEFTPAGGFTAGGSISSWDFLWAGDSLRLVELGIVVGPSRRDNLERGKPVASPLPVSTLPVPHEAFEEGSPALGSLVISWRGRIGVTGACPS